MTSYLLPFSTGRLWKPKHFYWPISTLGYLVLKARTDQKENIRLWKCVTCQDCLVWAFVQYDQSWLHAPLTILGPQKSHAVNEDCNVPQLVTYAILLPQDWQNIYSLIKPTVYTVSSLNMAHAIINSLETVKFFIEIYFKK